MDLVNSNSVLDTKLANLKYRCEVSCYYDKCVDDLLPYIEEVGVVRVGANKLNSETNQLFKCRQTFYVGSDPRMDKLLDRIISEHHIRNIKVSLPSEFEWDSFYNIDVEFNNDGKEKIEFHRVI